MVMEGGRTSIALLLGVPYFPVNWDDSAPVKNWPENRTYKFLRATCPYQWTVKSFDLPSIKANLVPLSEAVCGYLCIAFSELGVTLQPVELRLELLSWFK